MSRNTTDLKGQILRLDSIRAIKKAMLKAGIDIGNREIHINYLLDDLEALISNREKLARIEEIERIPYWGTPYGTEVYGYEKLFKDARLFTLRKELDRED